jgi:hypothetical protein
MILLVLAARRSPSGWQNQSLSFGFRLFGLFNLVYGVRALVQGIEVRRTRTALRSVVRPKVAA